MEKMKKRPYIYHTSTKNLSFLKMHKLLKSMGIKNNKFFLKLYDRDLENIDVYDENLDEMMQLKIAKEIRINVWYFLREVVRIPVSGSSGPGKRYELHRGNLALTWCQLNCINAIEELPRQNYKTISAVCNYLYFYNFKTTNSQFAFLNKKYPDSKLNLQRFKDLRECLPPFLRCEDRKDKNNLTYVRSALRRNEITAVSTAIDPDSADKLGRGNTQPLKSGSGII